MEGERDDRGHDLRGDLGELGREGFREARAVSALVRRPTARRDDLAAVFADDLVVLRVIRSLAVMCFYFEVRPRRNRAERVRRISQR